jgi:microcystin-dependent protein
VHRYDGTFPVPYLIAWNEEKIPMANPFLGQLALVGFNFAPTNWALAQGQTLAISSNTALFSLLGTMYGGNGTSNFALPNLQGKVSLGVGQSTGLELYVQGEVGGTQTVTLNPQMTPTHTHSLLVSSLTGDQEKPAGNAFGDAKQVGALYTATPTPPAPMSAQAVSLYGASGPHNNMMPYLTLNWIIALAGVYPPRN